MDSVEAKAQVLPALLNVNQAALYLGGISPKTVLNLVERGKLEPVYIAGRRLFRRTDLEQLAKTGT